MKVKIELTNGNIQVVELVSVTIYREEGTVFARSANSRHDFDGELEEVSRITVDNEIIYDFLGREERFKKEEVK